MMPRRPAQHSLSPLRCLWQPFCPLTLVVPLFYARLELFPAFLRWKSTLFPHPPLMQRGDREACQRESTCTKMEKTLSFSQ